MSSYVFQCVGLTGGTTDNLDAMDPSAFTGKEIAITVTDPTLVTRKVYTHQAVNSGAAADGVNIIAPVVTSAWRWHILNPSDAGALIFVPTGTPLPGTLETDGSAILRADYTDLYAAIGVIFGAGDGSTTFNLPDYRGLFLRIWDHGAGIDPDAATRTDRGDGTTGDIVGTKQADMFKLHSHPTQTYYHPSANYILASGTALGADTSTSGTNATGGNETRPVNVNIMCRIRY